MGKPSSPSSPDPYVVANAQTQSNIATANANAELNRVNQSTPYGSSAYNITGYNPDGTPQYTQQTQLSPTGQQLLDVQQQGQLGLGQTGLGLLNQVENAYQTPFGTDMPQKLGQQQQNAAYNEQAQYLDPQFAQGQSQLTQQLANQGLVPGTEAYNNAQGNFDRAKQAAYSNAANQAITTGNAAENQYYNQALQSYQQPLSIFNSLMSGAQPTGPAFSNVPGTTVANTPTAQIAQSAFNNQLAGYNASNQASNNLFSSLGLLGGAALSAPSSSALGGAVGGIGSWLGGLFSNPVVDDLALIP